MPQTYQDWSGYGTCLALIRALMASHEKNAHAHSLVHRNFRIQLYVAHRRIQSVASSVGSLPLAKNALHSPNTSRVSTGPLMRAARVVFGACPVSDAFM